jgi:hypothetical protein
MTEQFVEYKPPADGVAPRGWRVGMDWVCGTPDMPLDHYRKFGSKPNWASYTIYRVPPAALHYPIAPNEGEWGADIAVNGRPECLPDGQVCAVFDERWDGLEAHPIVGSWYWPTVTKIRLPANHPYYADNAEYGRVIPIIRSN